MVSTEQPQLSSVVEDEAEKESRRTESLPQYDAAITEYERHPAAAGRRAASSHGQHLLQVKSVSVSLARRQEGPLRGENVKKSLGNTSRENALATGSVTPDIAATIGLRPVPEPRVDY